MITDHNPGSMASTTHLLLGLGLAAYLLIVRALRYQRMRTTLRQYAHLLNSDATLGLMTLKEAYSIQLALATLEFPTTFSVSIFFALFKTYGIPSISSLLARTGELSSSTTASRRAADTGVLITEMILNQPGSKRNLSAIARMNWLHDLYRRAGKISDDDMLYTLSLFALEPIRWTRRLEWRELNDLERCAMGVYWRNLGSTMSIPYTRLPSAAGGWANGLEWLRELEVWSEEYEAEHLAPHASNKVVADATVAIGLTNIPDLLKPIGKQFALALLSPQLRAAMLYDDPPMYVQNIVKVGIVCRKWVLRHLMPPRPNAWPMPWLSEADAVTGRYHFEQYIGHPFYIKPTLGRRWGWKAWLLWFVGGYLPSDERAEFRPEGYRLEDLGPEKFEGRGRDEMMAAKDAILKMQGCPFHMTSK